MHVMLVALYFSFLQEKKNVSRRFVVCVELVANHVAYNDILRT